jgi:hypothetical protein
MSDKQHLPALRNAIGCALLTTIGFLAVGLALWILSWCLSNTHGFASAFVSNLAAESLGIAFGLIAATSIAWHLARNKVREVIPSIFRLIQALRIEGTIKEKGAQRSVICAVALLSEGNVRNAISREPEAPEGTKCPICALSIKLVPKDLPKRCMHCLIEGAIWNARDLVEEHESGGDQNAAEKL